MNPYDRNMAKKVTTFLEGWDAGVVPYAESWKLNHFNRVKYETIRTLREKLSTKLKKKATEVCKTQNVPPDHMTQEDNMSQSYETD